MKFSIKKLIASTLAAATLAGVTVIGASAYNKSEPWETYHTKTAYASGYTGYADTVSVVYSTYGSMCYQTSVSTSVGGGTGHVYITCVNANATMTPIIIGSVLTNEPCKPVFVGTIECSTYTLRAYSDTLNATYTASGKMETIE